MVRARALVGRRGDERGSGRASHRLPLPSARWKGPAVVQYFSSPMTRALDFVWMGGKKRNGRHRGPGLRRGTGLYTCVCVCVDGAARRPPEQIWRHCRHPHVDCQRARAPGGGGDNDGPRGNRDSRGAGPAKCLFEGGGRVGWGPKSGCAAVLSRCGTRNLYVIRMDHGRAVIWASEGGWNLHGLK
jgi:hypothetical protein